MHLKPREAKHIETETVCKNKDNLEGVEVGECVPRHNDCMGKQKGLAWK